MISLHVIDDYKIGGTQNLAVRTWTGLEARGENLSVAVLVSSARERTELFEERSTVRVGFHGDYRKPFALSSCARRLTNIISQTKPDVLHSWLWLSDVVTAKAAAKCGIPHVSHIVDRRNWQISGRIKDRIRRFITMRAFAKADTRFLAVSQAAADFASMSLRIPAHRITVAYNSIEPTEFANIPRSDRWQTNAPIRLGIAARIEPEKGHQYAIQALRILKDRGIPCELAITGDGPLKASLFSLANQLQLVDCVRFVGWVPNVKSFLADIDVFLVPSVDSEGLPTTILESMAAGRVVVGTDVGGAVEAISSGVNGLIVPPKDATAIADAVAMLHANRSFGGQMADKGIEVVREKFAMSRMLDTIQETYQQMMKGTRS
jgi:glycosyltransferase involved in cell wall biosynthesis